MLIVDTGSDRAVIKRIGCVPPRFREHICWRLKVIENQNVTTEASHALGRFRVATSPLRSVEFRFGIFREFQFGKESLDVRITNKNATIVAELELQIGAVANPDYSYRRVATKCVDREHDRGHQ